MLRKPKPQAIGLTPNVPLFSLKWLYKTYGSGAGQSAGGGSFADFWSRAKTTGS
jgi:hypothetical protein